MAHTKNVVIKFGVSVGDIVSVNTMTAPTTSGYWRITGTVLEIYPSGAFKLSASDPYFGYNIFTSSDIIK